MNANFRIPTRRANDNLNNPKSKWLNSPTKFTF